MPNKKINQLDARVGAALTDLILIGDPTSGTSYKLTATDFKTLLNSVPYTGATTNVNLGEYGISGGYFQADLTPTLTGGIGRLIWNDTDGTLDLGLKGGNVTLQIGQEQVQRVVNKSGADLLESAYQVVKVTDAQGQRLAVNLAQGNNDANSADTLGIVTETIANNQEGFICTSGIVRGINTTGSLQGETWIDGDILYLSPTTPGAITKVKPTAPDHSVILGYVVYAHANNGKIFVKCENGYESSELHDIYTPVKNNNDSIFWNSTNNRYESNSISGVLGFTPVSGNIYTTDGTLTGNRVVTMGANTLTFNGTSGSAIKIAYTDATNGTPPIQGTFGAATGLLQLVADGSGNSLFQNNFASLIFKTGSTPANALVINNSKVSRFYGDIIFNNISSALQFDDGTSGWGGKISSNASTGALELTARFSTAPITFITSNGTSNVVTEKARITAAGRLLLGTTAESTYLLDVNGSARVSGDIRTQNGTTYTDLKANATSGLFLNALIPATFDLYFYMNRNSVYGGNGVSLSSTNTGTGDISSFHNFNVQDFWSRSVNTRDINIATLGGTSGDNKFLTFGLVDASNSDGAIRFRVAGWGNSAIMGVTTRTGRNRNDFDFRVGYGATDLNTGTLAYRINGDSGNFIIGSVGTNVASAILNVDSTTKGFLPPRMTTTEKNAIVSPATGLQVYDTTLGSVSVYDGTSWRNDNATLTTNRQTASYTLALSDRGKLVEMNVATANNLTVPLNSVIAFSIGTKIDLSQYGAGQTTVVATGGVTIRSAGGALKLAAQYSGASLVKVGTDEWYLFGDITV